MLFLGARSRCSDSDGKLAIDLCACPVELSVLVHLEVERLCSRIDLLLRLAMQSKCDKAKDGLCEDCKQVRARP